MMKHGTLTSVNPDLEKKIADTVPGMAHWAGTGPKKKFCGDCVFLVKRQGVYGYGCQKYMRMMGNMPRDPIPRRTRSCKYFEQRG